MNCPSVATQAAPAHPFVQNHYYCEYGVNDQGSNSSHFTDDSLWDGAGCFQSYKE